jgi:hypothetical protein
MDLNNNRLFHGDRKIDYLQNGSKYDEMTKPVIMLWFDKASVIEAATMNLDGTLGKDLCEFNLTEIKNMYISFNLRSRGTLNTISYFFADYYNWCVAHGYIDNSNIQNYYAGSDIKRIIDDAVPVELVEDKFFTRTDIDGYRQMITDETDEFLLYAVFNGVCGHEYEDLKMLKLSDINEKEKTVNLYSGKVLSIDDVFIKLAKLADEQKYYHPEGVVKQTQLNSYDNSYYIFKTSRQNIPNLPVNKQIITKKFLNIKKQVENRFVICKNVYFNGMIDYVKTQLLANDKVTLKSGFFKKDMSGNYYYSKKIDQYLEEFGYPITSRALRKYLKDYKDLYE